MILSSTVAFSFKGTSNQCITTEPLWSPHCRGQASWPEPVYIDHTLFVHLFRMQYWMANLTIAMLTSSL